jgi:hypothetical protein
LANGRMRESWVTTNTPREKSLTMRESTVIMLCPFALSNAAVAGNDEERKRLPAKVLGGGLHCLATGTGAAVGERVKLYLST